MGICFDSRKACFECFNFGVVGWRSKSFFSIFLLLLTASFVFIFVFIFRLQEFSESAVTSAFQANVIQSREADISTESGKIIFVGDIMLSRSVGRVMEEKNDYRYPFLRVADILRDADITFGNLEGPMSARGENVGSKYSFRADPMAIEGLIIAGFDILSVANNHIWDWGADALVDTVDILSENDIVAVGAGANESSANKAGVLEAGGASVGFFAYTTLYPKSLEAVGVRAGISDLSRAEVEIMTLGQSVDLVVVSLHWGEEYKVLSNNGQQELARKLIDAGADIIVGHHPHVSQEIERYGDGWIIYSLGNFVFDQTFSEATRNGLVAVATVENGVIVDIETTHVYISETFQPAFIDL